MIVTEIVLTAIGGLVAVGAALYKAMERRIPCNSCQYPFRRGGTWRFCCLRPDHNYWPDSFDVPPTYCKSYKPRDPWADGKEHDS